VHKRAAWHQRQRSTFMLCLGPCACAGCPAHRAIQWPGSKCDFLHELVASFRSRRSVSHGPRCRATASYESRAVSTMVGLQGSAWGGHARDRHVCGLCTPAALPAHVSVFSHNFKRFERCTKLATSSVDGVDNHRTTFPQFARKSPKLSDPYQTEPGRGTRPANGSRPRIQAARQLWEQLAIPPSNH